MVVPYKTTDFFIAKAKQNGEIVSIDEKLKLIKVQYKDGSTDVFEYGEIPGESSGSLVNHHIDMHPNVKVGAKFKECINFNFGLMSASNSKYFRKSLLLKLKLLDFPIKSSIVSSILQSIALLEFVILFI